MSSALCVNLVSKTSARSVRPAPRVCGTIAKPRTVKWLKTAQHFVVRCQFMQYRMLGWDASPGCFTT